jgi:hypothetical protein
MREALSGWLSAVRLECRILRDEAYLLEMDDRLLADVSLTREGVAGGALRHRRGWQNKESDPPS